MPSPRHSRARLIVLVGLATACLGAATRHAQATNGSWGPTTDLAGGNPTTSAQAVADPKGGVLLFYTASGRPTVQAVSDAGTLGPASAVPAYSTLGNFGTPGQIAFLADGAAIVTWQLPPYGSYMAYRSPSGTWGSPVRTADGLASVAVRSGEVLTSEGGGSGVTADDWTLAGDGTLTHNSGPTTVFTGSPLFNQSFVTLDPSGSAVIVTLAYTQSLSNEEVYETVRSSSGTWGAQQSLSGTAHSMQTIAFAAAPGGHAVVAWEDASSLLAPTMSAAVHVSGSGFGPAHLLSAPTSTYFAYALPIVGAGGDGSLAIGVSNEIGNGPYAGNFTTTNEIWALGPSAATIPGGTFVTDTTDKFLFSSLGAGNSAAIAGVHEEVIFNSGQAHPDSYNATESTSAIVLSAKGVASSHQFASVTGLYDGNGGDGCTECDGTSPPAASVSGVALDANGLAVAVGQLHPGGNLSTAAQSGASTPKPKVTITSKHVHAGKHAAKVSLRCAAAKCKGDVALFTTHHQKTTILGSSKYTLAAGKHKAESVTLTPAGRKAFKHAAKHAVTVSVAASATGGTTATRTVKVS